MRESNLKEIFDMFDGHCHFCGDQIEFYKRGWATQLAGHWEADHVVQRKKGGGDDINNLLPACTRCNRLRWGRSGGSLRRVLLLGLVAKNAAYHYQESHIGPQVRSRRIQQLGDNWYKRMRVQLVRQSKGLTGKQLTIREAGLRKRKASLMRALAQFEEQGLKQLRARRGQKWDDVLTKLREKYRKEGTHRAWPRAERALGE